MPLVRVSKADGRLTLVQRGFALDPATIAGLPVQSWRQPLVVQDLGKPAERIILRGQATRPSHGPTLVNAGQKSYASVLYDAATHRELTAHFAQLAAVDQLGLINDSYALAISGDAPASHFLELLAAIPVDANPIVWQRALGVMAEVDSQYAGQQQRGAYRRFALSVLAPLAQRIGATNAKGELSNLTVLRSTLSFVQGRFGDGDTLARAHDLVTRGGAPADQRIALTIVAAHSDAAMFEDLLAQATATSDPLQRSRLLDAMAGVEDPSLAQRMIDIALGPLPPAGSASRLSGRLASDHPDLVWDAVAERLEDPDWALDSKTRWRLVILVAGRSSLPVRAAQLQAYEERNVPENARKPFMAATASINKNQRFVRDVIPQIDQWIGKVLASQ